MPEPEHIFVLLSRAKYLFKLDLVKDIDKFQSVRLTKLAFSIPDGQYQCQLMPFGILTAPSVFTKMMRLIIESINEEYMSNFKDNVLVATETKEQK